MKKLILAAAMLLLPLSARAEKPRIWSNAGLGFLQRPAPVDSLTPLSLADEATIYDYVDDLVAERDSLSLLASERFWEARYSDQRYHIVVIFTIVFAAVSTLMLYAGSRIGS